VRELIHTHTNRKENMGEKKKKKDGTNTKRNASVRQRGMKKGYTYVIKMAMVPPAYG
jgi:hypothetical protein